ncbi:MAG: ATP-binding protein [Chitinophagaceae bacterium]
MIKLEEIIIKEFRGLRDISLNLNSSNFAICGSNGTGKSGIVDAIEFCFTGSISRLSGAGTGNVSVRDHGPHVDFRANPEKATVSIKFKVLATGNTATLTRTVKNITKPTLIPETEETKAAVGHMLQHPEFVLSRRELIKYILAEPGKRSQEVQALLRLEEIDNLRKVLLKIANAEAKPIKTLTSEKAVAAENLCRTLGIEKIAVPELLKEVNIKRSLLQLPALTTFDAKTCVKDGLSTTSSSTVISSINKTVTLKDVESVFSAIDSIQSDGFAGDISKSVELLQSLVQIGEDPKGPIKEKLLQDALAVFDEKSCPVCDTPWESQTFNGIVQDKLENLKNITSARVEFEMQLERLVRPMEALLSSLSLVVKPAGVLKPAINTEPVDEFIHLQRDKIHHFRQVFPIADKEAQIAEFSQIPPQVLDFVRRIQAKIALLPEPTLQDAARDYLVASQERIEVYRDTSRKLNIAVNRASISNDILDTYNSSTTAELEKIYVDVKDSFIDLYKSINADEAQFNAQLTPSSGKLGFDVDFYGRGFFPPGAYHSEGHQDSMGLCLYLALMDHLLGGHFTFAVLDDVLMSVDSGHRREVTKLLKVRFPNVQFIMTTHDDVWLKTMKSSGLINSKGFCHFRKWTVDDGPLTWQGKDIWQEIEDHVQKNDIRAAAAQLRNYLEYIAQEICHNLRAQVSFRADGQYALGDLLPGALSGLGNKFKQAKKSAQSWNNQELMTSLNTLDQDFTNAKVNSNAESWQVNPAVHYNEWANFDKKDFEPVIVAYKTLLDFFACAKCNGLIYISPEYGAADSLRCPCADVNINLIEKQKNKS